MPGGRDANGGGARPARHRRCVSGAVLLGRLILIATFSMLATDVIDRQLGANSFDERERTALQHHRIHRLQHLGYQVTLELVRTAVRIAVGSEIAADLQ